MTCFRALILLSLTSLLTLSAQAAIESTSVGSAASASSSASTNFELGLAYGYKVTTFDSNNSYASESVTGSLSIYFSERMAIEGSYSLSRGVRQEKVTPTDPQRTTYEQTAISGLDLIYVFADRRDFFQPFVKGGVAYINRSQQVKIEGWDTFTLSPDNAITPSYGLGFKLAITDAFGLKFSYEAWQTPIGGGQNTQDSSLRAGITWML